MDVEPEHEIRAGPFEAQGGIREQPGRGRNSGGELASGGLQAELSQRNDGGPGDELPRVFVRLRTVDAVLEAKCRPIAGVEADLEMADDVDAKGGILGAAGDDDVRTVRMEGELAGLASGRPGGGRDVLAIDKERGETGGLAGFIGTGEEGGTIGEDAQLEGFRLIPGVGMPVAIGMDGEQDVVVIPPAIAKEDEAGTACDGGGEHAGRICLRKSGGVTEQRPNRPFAAGVPTPLRGGESAHVPVIPPEKMRAMGGRGEGKQQAGPAFIADSITTHAGAEPDASVVGDHETARVQGLLPPGVGLGFRLQVGITDGAEGEEGAEQEDAAIAEIADALLGDADLVHIPHVAAEILLQKSVTDGSGLLLTEGDHLDQFPAPADSDPIRTAMRSLQVGMAKGGPGVESGGEPGVDPRALVGSPGFAAPIVGVGKGGADGGPGEAVALFGGQSGRSGVGIDLAKGGESDGAEAWLSGELVEKGRGGGAVAERVGAGSRRLVDLSLQLSEHGGLGGRRYANPLAEFGDLGRGEEQARGRAQNKRSKEEDNGEVAHKDILASIHFEQTVVRGVRW